MPSRSFANRRVAVVVALVVTAALVGVGSVLLTRGTRSSFLSGKQAREVKNVALGFASESGEKHPYDVLIVRSHRRRTINVVWKSDAAVANQPVFVITMKG